MKERPILFSGPMVKAILEGRKTQARRIIRFNPFGGKCRPTIDHLDEVTKAIFIHDIDKNNAAGVTIKCPHGTIGDRLWVRETFAQDYNPPFKYYRADEMLIPHRVRWKPSIHMPRWASRIDLEITNIRVERLQDISEEDAKSEGVSPSHGPGCTDANSHVASFAALWDSLNNARGFGWNANPWVWVIEFRRIKP